MGSLPDDAAPAPCLSQGFGGEAAVAIWESQFAGVLALASFGSLEPNDALLCCDSEFARGVLSVGLHQNMRGLGRGYGAVWAHSTCSETSVVRNGRRILLKERSNIVGVFGQRNTVVVKDVVPQDDYHMTADVHSMSRQATADLPRHKKSRD